MKTLPNSRSDLTRLIATDRTQFIFLSPFCRSDFAERDLAKKGGFQQNLLGIRVVDNSQQYHPNG